MQYMAAIQAFLVHTGQSEVARKPRLRYSQSVERNRPLKWAARFWWFQGVNFKTCRIETLCKMQAFKTFCLHLRGNDG